MIHGRKIFVLKITIMCNYTREMYSLFKDLDNPQPHLQIRILKKIASLEQNHHLEPEGA